MQRTLRMNLDSLLHTLYGTQSSQTLHLMSSQLLQSSSSLSANNHSSKRWDASTCVLITYADSIQDGDAPGLKTLRSLLNTHLPLISSVVHVLPFLKATSDGGFAVASHDQLEERHGTWADLDALAEGRTLMADLVLNHISASHPWVQDFLNDAEPGRSCILTGSPDPCWDDVVRPRSSALFSTLHSSNGAHQVWTTFGPDQVDVDWRSPDVLRGFTELMARFCQHGVSWIRLDAVGFIWKEPFTNCIHRPEAHSVVEVLRLLLEEQVPAGVVVSETNVPEQENLSYLRSGREAHLAYNFPLPPLLLEAAISGKADLLNQWLNRWPNLPEQTGLLNFTASHDGIGLRPLEGLMDQSRLIQLLIRCEQRGGLISHRRLHDGSDAPYEINISWWSAMADGGIDPGHLQIERFLATQFLVLALPGIPAFYLPALLATPNDLARFRRTGHRRDLNRPTFRYSTLDNRLKDPHDPASIVLQRLRDAMTIRTTLPAFDPDAPMQVLSAERFDAVILQRGQDDQRVWAIHNLTPSRLTINPAVLDLGASSSGWRDHLHPERTLLSSAPLELDPFDVCWLQQECGR